MSIKSYILWKILYELFILFDRKIKTHMCNIMPLRIKKNQ